MAFTWILSCRNGATKELPAEIRCEIYCLLFADSVTELPWVDDKLGDHRLTPDGRLDIKAQHAQNSG
jgi:hypothetical protein